MYKILCKYPTRQRPKLFLETLSEYINRSVNKEGIHYLISIDEDDYSMTDEVIEKAKQLHPNITFVSGKSSSKIDACNRDMDIVTEWDICLLISDDMKVAAYGWDERLRNDMQRAYPDTDGCLWYHDGAQNAICTLSCIGRKYYDRFGYLYHPSYKSFFCDNEFTEVAKSQDKIKYFSSTIIKHQHPSWQQGISTDSLYQRNDTFWAADETNYHNRKAGGFK